MIRMCSLSNSIVEPSKLKTSKPELSSNRICQPILCTPGEKFPEVERWGENLERGHSELAKKKKQLERDISGQRFNLRKIASVYLRLNAQLQKLTQFVFGNRLEKYDRIEFGHDAEHCAIAHRH